ncbi:helix-turn-helix transcriptional regulator [Anabaena sp. FACHB-1237]|uniref:ArsR/SmtB family transcription factor n=1 Tax=Anabaena sp. FACHB-1237 TaxID=2692769 RepID=UPI0016808E17|nr:metalloregulator ArsR/SmtB family transcription factor [Anabaena sp. FACHB-1237]MBD2136595.1 helix-turn-helix transcriptional regulator [Anabaena sp. FACHB-1237]
MLATSPQVLTPIADYFKMLSEVSRLQVLCALKSGPRNVTEIVSITEMGQANVSKHLKLLTQAGIVSRQPQGSTVYYQIGDPIIFEICELVCNRLNVRLQEQTQQLEQLEVLRQ